MKKLHILVADNSYLIRQGLQRLIESRKDLCLCGEAVNAEELTKKLRLCTPDILIIDYSSRHFCTDDIAVIRLEFPAICILAITPPRPKEVISAAVENGVMSHLLQECSRDEILEAIYSTGKGEKFFCGKIVDLLLKERSGPSGGAMSCNGIKLTVREIEIIRLVARGLPNKIIADTLFLSAHTVATHRKNILSKTGVGNSAGLVMFALQNHLLGSQQA